MIIVGCSHETESNESPPKLKIANPASVYCEEHDGRLEIRDEAGGQVGYCTFSNGTECEEWAFYRGECPNEESAQDEEKVNVTNNILEIPASVEQGCIGFVMGAPDEMEMANEIGGSWARPHPGPFAWGWIEKEKGEFDFERTDEYAKEAQNNDIAILATIWPFADWDQSKCHADECYVSEEDIFYPRTKMGLDEGIPKSRCAPCNMEDYKNFISKVVERYDGDGINDMPGLKIPVKYWEILNEPEMSDKTLTFYKGTQEEYVEILKASSEAIKTACPDCRIVHGGAAGIQDYMLNYWEEIFKLDGQQYIDIANIHYIRSSDLSTLNVDGFKKMLDKYNIDKPIWVTEAEYASESEIESSFNGALEAGADKVFFTQFKVGQFGLPAGGKYSEAYKELNCE